MKLFLFLLLLGACIGVAAQDSLQVTKHNGKPLILHKVKTGETLFMLARRYAVPPALLADINKKSYQDGLLPGSTFLVPVASYNFLRSADAGKGAALFYVTEAADNLSGISQLLSVSQGTIQRWNNMQDNTLKPGYRLHTGWIQYDRTQVPFNSSAAESHTPSVAVIQAPDRFIARKEREEIKPAQKPQTDRGSGDTAADEQPTEYRLLYEKHSEGAATYDESGAAVFYPLKIKVAEGVYYAFHNTAAKGAILRIENPANGKVVYAKVIGTIPALKEYHNAVAGLSSNAASVLGAMDKKMFCKISYR